MSSFCIDFYPGSHGNFLQLLLHAYVFRDKINFSQPFFDDRGACHLKWHDQTYKPKIQCNHYSTLGLPIDPATKVIEVHVDPDYKITVLINNLLRSNNESIDIWNLENHTTQKLKSIKKGQSWLSWLQNQYGKDVDSYPRWALRARAFADLSTGHYNNFSHTGAKYCFAHEGLFDIESLERQLLHCAAFMGLKLDIDENFSTVWHQFMSLNVGLNCKIKCDRILDALHQGQRLDLPRLSFVEEAWLIYKMYQGKVVSDYTIKNYPDCLWYK